MKSPIRWAGSKKALLPHLRRHWTNPASRYIEPFCGSACFYFDVSPTKAILGDLNSELIDTYRGIRSDPEAVATIFANFVPEKSTFLELRQAKTDSLSLVERAARFLFLNRFAFNGIYRTNLKGMFNVPFAAPKQSRFIDPDDLIGVGKRLVRAKLVAGDFEKVLELTEAGDFVYLDPPFAVSTRRIFREYHPDSFAQKDIERLKAWLRELDDRKVIFLVSYADSPEGRELTNGWHRKRVRTRRNIAGFSGHRRVAYEILATNRAEAL